MKKKTIISLIIFLFIGFGLIIEPINLFVTNSENFDLNNKLLISSLNKTYVQEWNFTWEGPPLGSGYAINYDSLSNVYIAGITYDPFIPDIDIFLAKFNSSGHFQWNETFGGDGLDLCMDIALDSNDNIYLVGSVENDMGSRRLFLVKYNSLGEFQWNRTWGGSYLDFWYGIALDSYENVFVVGATQNFTTYTEICLVKFDSTGHYQWNRTWGGNYMDMGYDIVLDSSDNIYIAGIHGREADNDVCLLKFNNLGEYQWNRTYDNANYDLGIGIALDSMNNIYILGLTINWTLTQSKLLLVKYDSTGTLDWEKIWGENGSNTFYGLALDSKNNIYTAGVVNYSTVKNQDFCLIQFDASGVEQFVHQWGENKGDGYGAIIIDSSDNIYLTGIRNDNQTYIEKYSKIDFNGQFPNNLISFGNSYIIFIIFTVSFLAIVVLKKSRLLK